MEGEVCKGQQGRGRKASSLGLGGYKEEGGEEFGAKGG